MSESAFTSDPLLLDLYGCCADASRWGGVLDRLCAAIGARSAVIQGIAFDAGARGRPFWCAHDTRTNLADYEHLISDARNPRLDGRRVAAGLGRLTGDEGLFPSPEDAPAKQRLQDLLSELGLGRFLGGLMPIGQGRFVGLALHRDVRDRDPYSPAARERLGALLPHIAQAVALGHTVASTRTLESALCACLDRWHCGLLLCDAAGQVQWMNRAASRRLAAGGALQLRDGLLHAVGSQDRALRTAISLQALSAQESAFIALDCAAGPRLHIALQPLQTMPGVTQASGVLVMMTDADLAGEIPPAALRALFDLTEAESRLASALVQGDTLEQYAQRRGVSVGTVRYQLKQVLAKTGANRQSDLVRKVLCSAAAHAAGFAAEAVRVH